MIFFAYLFLIAGFAFAIKGALGAWYALSPADATKNLRVAGFGGGLLFFGFVLWLVLKALFPGGDPATPPTEPPATATGIDQAELARRLAAEEARRTAEAAGSGATATGSTTTPTEKPADPPATATGEISPQNPAPAVPSEPLPEGIDAGTLRSLAGGGTGKSRYRGEIEFLGFSYEKNGVPNAELFVGEDFQINVKVKNADVFVWDTDTSIDSDRDGVSDNDFDKITEDPELRYDAPGSHELRLTAANGDTVMTKTLKVTIKNADPIVDFLVKNDPADPARVRVDAGATRVRAAGETEFVWTVGGEPTELESPAPDGRSGTILLGERGDHAITLEVRTVADRDVFSAKKTETATVATLLAGAVRAEPDFATVPATVALDFVPIADDIARPEAARIEWDFGDGRFVDGRFSESKKFTEPGVRTVRARVTDAAGATRIFAKEIWLSDGGRPIPRISVKPDGPGNLGTIFRFDAGESRAVSGSAMEFSWDFGDGSELAAGTVATHRFPARGDFTVKLTATDRATGKFARTEKTILIKNAPPVAAFEILPETGRLVRFDASGSTDPDGPPAKFLWDFGDGERAATTEPEVSHIFGESGDFAVRLTVRDDAGATDSLEKSFELR